MNIKMMNNITTFKNVLQYQIAEFNNIKPQLLLYQPISGMILDDIRACSNQLIQVMVCISSQLCIQWYLIGSLKVDMLGGFTQWNFLSATNQTFLPPPPTPQNYQLLNTNHTQL